MQDPAKEIEDGVGGLVEKPTLERQADVLRTHFTKDVQFTHFHINTTSGVKDLIAIYQMAELIVNYQGVELQSVVYDNLANALTLRMTIFIRPLGILPLTLVTIGSTETTEMRSRRGFPSLPGSLDPVLRF